ncbi:hypothetical protein FPQ18DRAFT_380999 [Pyronema domesticum]|uniref:Similar to UPF0593 mitochondrial protein C806.05 acc. no. Q9UT54 n=1 Tax=Pyronema omphalodes (strain CBS 100304) TaxID=1076935 RepID=U4LS00_PYROM|nr:hypothetical protein FPQ18DRAFT_380999 [Pyronema domesticum]CCX34961.1 Similar to UPF0593 mitochondrial protein C806.05; acc. no. Q9UT54 [Pyronema omphalodes CBS 100304]
MASPITAQAIPTKATLITTYRHLMKAGLFAVQYSNPARFQIRDKLRDAFRYTPVEHYNPRRIQNTIDFLYTAGRYKGLEHKIVKNLCFVHYHDRTRKRKRLLGKTLGIEDITHNAYLENLGLLNQSMDLDLR